MLLEVDDITSNVLGSKGFFRMFEDFIHKILKPQENELQLDGVATRSHRVDARLSSLCNSLMSLNALRSFHKNGAGVSSFLRQLLIQSDYMKKYLQLCDILTERYMDQVRGNGVNESNSSELPFEHSTMLLLSINMLEFAYSDDDDNDDIIPSTTIEQENEESFSGLVNKLRSFSLRAMRILGAEKKPSILRPLLLHCIKSIILLARILELNPESERCKQLTNAIYTLSFAQELIVLASEMDQSQTQIAESDDSPPDELPLFIWALLQQLCSNERICKSLLKTNLIKIYNKLLQQDLITDLTAETSRVHLDSQGFRYLVLGTILMFANEEQLTRLPCDQLVQGLRVYQDSLSESSVQDLKHQVKGVIEKLEERIVTG